MRDIEHAAIVAYLVVFIYLRTVVHWHVPAAKVHHFRAQRAVRRIQGGLFKNRHGRFPKIKKGAARIRAAPHLSSIPERLQLALCAPSVAGLACALQICLCQWFLMPERLRVLRLRRWSETTLSHGSKRQRGLCGTRQKLTTAIFVKNSSRLPSEKFSSKITRPVLGLCRNSARRR